MIASLYQRGSVALASLLHASTLPVAARRPERAVSLPRLHAEDVRRPRARPQCHIIATAAPRVLLAAQQVFHEEAFIGGKAELVEVEIRPAGLLVKDIKIDDGQYPVVEIGRRF